MSTPTGPMLRYGELVQWLGRYKVSDRQVRQLIDKGVIKRYGLGTSWRLFNKEQIEREVLSALGITPNGTPRQSGAATITTEQQKETTT